MTKDKSQAELEIEALAEVFNIANSGFEKFYKEANKKDKGDYSTAASSGNSSTAASSGDSSTAASSGDYSTAASSGNSSKAASSGYNSKAASSGNYSTAASSGDYSKAASSGDYSTAASSGYNSKAASSGNYSTAASSGNSSKAASSGNYSTAASSGDYSKAECSGKHSACASVGYRGAVRGDLGNGIAAFEYNDKGELLSAKADIIDGKKLKPQQWYIVEDGEWQAVDFADGIFTRVVSVRNGVKKVRNGDGKILFIVSDDNGNHAHGETIKEARESLVYKSVAKFDGKVPKSATGTEWVAIYRGVTGACAAGVRMFVEEMGKDLDGKYTAKQILKFTEGRFGHEQFKKAVNNA